LSRHPYTFRQSNLTRALKGTRAAGIDVERIEIDKDGKIVIITGKPDEGGNGEASNPWDEVLTHVADKERPS
jgi:hypothetical protein